MSADNWAYCPQCLEDAVNKQEELQKKANSAYGKIPQDAYLSLLERIKIEPPKEPTLREYYHIRTNELGIFEVTYHCECDICRFSFKFNHKEQLMVERKTA